MRCYLSSITTPTADTPGSLFVLHFDDRRYIIGNLAEGSTRAITEGNVSLRKVSDVFLTGRTRWSNLGGLLGLVLGLADTKTAAAEAAKASAGSKQDDGDTRKVASSKGGERLNIYGAPNLNHVIATARRFIFRRGLPLSATEYAHTLQPEHASVDATYIDDRVLVWAMPLLPSGYGPSEHASPHANSHSPQRSSRSRKRSLDEANGRLSPEAKSRAQKEEIENEQDEHQKLRKNVVHNMFNSNWRYDRLVEKKLADVSMPATCYLRDPDTKQLTVYTGPKPGQNKESIPDINVLVREPWPSSQIDNLPPTSPSEESLCYIFRNHQQRGKFMADKARELGVPKEKNKELTAGRSVRNAEGKTISPEMVLEPGKPGSGFAVIDLPSVGYIDSLVGRREWNADNVTQGLETMIWILGPDVGSDSRIADFQKRFSAVKHFVSSASYQDNTIALDGAATNAMRHNYVDAEVFPRLVATHPDPEQPQSLKTARLAADLPDSIPMKRGQKIVIEPKYELDDSEVMPLLDIPSVDQKVEDEFAKFPELLDGTKSQPSEEATNEWEEALGEYKDVEVIVLGTGSSHPSKYRNVSGTLVRVPGWGSLLLDAGEGTMNTLRRMFSQVELDKILLDLKLIWISHLHADHHLGLTSVITAWNEARMLYDPPSESQVVDEQGKYWGEMTGLLRPRRKLAIVSHDAMSQWLHEYDSVENISPSNLFTVVANAPGPFAIPASFGEQSTRLLLQHSEDGPTDIGTKKILPQLGLKSLNSTLVNHCHGAQAVSMTFPSGFKLSYSGDCRPCAAFTNIGHGSHLLIHEATFEDDMRPEAIAKKHSTAGEALIVAAEMEAKVCVLTHFSQRYPTMPPLGVNVEAKGPSTPLRSSAVLDRGDRSLRNEQASPAKSDVEAPKLVMDDGDDATDEVQEAQQLKRNKNASESMWSSAEKEARGEEWAQKRGIKLAESQLIDQKDVQRLIDQNDIKVVFAFDYMRLKLGNVPRLLMKQPILRAMYDNGIGKELITPLTDDMQVDGGEIKGETAKMKEKRVKKEKAQAEQKANEEKKKAKRERIEKERQESSEKRRAKAEETRAQQEGRVPQQEEKMTAAGSS